MQKLKSKITECLSDNDKIDFALLFGSFATNNYGNLSDIDIAIHLNEDVGLIELGTMISNLEKITLRKVDL